MERFAGRYGLLKQLGKGGMGEVFLAVDLETGAECALKRLTAVDGKVDTEALRAEFEALARVRHPAVVRVVELGFDFEGAPFLVMERVVGWPANEVVKPGNFEDLARVAMRVASGLEAIHAAGVSHGDLKPENILVGELGGVGNAQNVRIVDFGLASMTGRAGEGQRGTPGFTAPEVVRGAPPDAASDLYALGATLFKLASGKVPFEGADVAVVLHQQQLGPPSPAALEATSTPEPWIRLILQLMGTSPAERPASAVEVRKFIERIAPSARIPLADRIGAESLAGRATELARLDREWRRASTSARSFIVVGEGGIGKTALLDGFATMATLSNRSVVRISAHAGNRPGAIWRAIGRKLAAEARVDWKALSPEIRAALEDLAPDPDEAALKVVGDSMAEWCRTIATRAREAEAPCIVIDDIDAIDSTSLRALRRSMLDSDSAPSFWLVARRGDEGSADDQERLMVGAGKASFMKLARLGRTDVTGLVAARLGEVPADELVEFLWQRAGGHPGMTVESLRLAAASGALRETAFGIHVDRAGLDSLPRLADFEVARLERILGLEPVLVRAATVLAAYGRAVSTTTVERVDSAVTVDSLLQLLARGLITRDLDNRWCLVPPALGPRLLESIPPEERATLIGAVLDAGDLSARERFNLFRSIGNRALAIGIAEEAFAEGSDAALAIEVARLIESDDARMAASWLTRAARVLMDTGRYRDAAPLLEGSLTLDAQPDMRGQRWGMLSTCRLRIGDLGGVERVAVEAHKESLGDAALATICLNEAGRETAMGRFAAASELANSAAALAKSAGDLPVYGMARLSECTVLMNLNRLPEASVAAEDSRQAFARAGSGMGVARADGLRAQLLQLSGNTHGAEAMYRQAFEEAERQHLRLPAEELATGLSGVLITIGRWKEARDFQSRALRLAIEDARGFGTASGVVTLAQLDALVGTLDLASDEIRRGARLCRRHAPNMSAYVARVRALVLRNQGLWGRSRRAAEEAVRMARRAGYGLEVDWCCIELARTRARMGDWKSATELAEATFMRSSRGGQLGDVVLAVLAARGALREGHRERANEMLSKIREWPDTQSAYAAAITLQLEAELALVANGTGAVELADRALKAFEELPAAPERAHAAYEFAALLPQAGGSQSAAQRWLDQAVKECGRLRDRKGREAALALSVDWLKKSPGGRSDPSPEGNLLEAMVELLDSMSDFSELTQRAMRLVVEQLNAERGVLFLMNQDTGRLESREEYGAVDATYRSKALTHSRSVVEHITESGGTLLIHDAPTGPIQSASIVDLGLQSVLCVPIRYGGHLLGAVYLDHSKRRGAFKGAKEQLEKFAELLARAIENSRGAEEVRLANEKLTGENLSLRQEVQSRFQIGGIVGASTAMRRVLSVAERASQVDASVLLTGESGVGKEEIARVLHFSGARKDGPFVPINCGAFPEALLESELFGHMAGAFTDAKSDHVGKFVQAHRGTLFLDEIGEMPTNQQVRLIRVLASHEVTPLRGSRPIPVDVRIIAATNQNLGKRISEGAFRTDLFYRLNVIPIEIPPLRDRKADIPPLARHFVQKFATTQHRDVPELSPEFMKAIMQSNWPGNVRELENYIERVMAMSPSKILYPSPLPADLERTRSTSVLPKKGGLDDQLEDFEKRAIQIALDEALGNQSKAARALRLSEQTLRYRMKKHGLEMGRKNLRVRKKSR